MRPRRFYLFGFGFAYGNKSGTADYTLIGDDYFFLSGKFEEEQSWQGFFFQFVFAATAATIVSGAVAERCKISAFALYSFYLTAFVYPVVVHQIWCGCMCVRACVCVRACACVLSRVCRSVTSLSHACSWICSSPHGCVARRSTNGFLVAWPDENNEAGPIGGTYLGF